MEQTASSGGAYGVQVLIAGRQKHWRDDVAAQIRRAGYATTTVDCGVDAMTVLALGLPVDVLVTDSRRSADPVDHFGHTGRERSRYAARLGPCAVPPGLPGAAPRAAAPAHRSP